MAGRLPSRSISHRAQGAGAVSGTSSPERISRCELTPLVAGEDQDWRVPDRGDRGRSCQLNGVRFGNIDLRIVADVGVGALGFMPCSPATSVMVIDDPEQAGYRCRCDGGVSSGMATPVESVIPGVRRQQGVHRRVWIGVDASHVDRGSSVEMRSNGIAQGTTLWHRKSHVSRVPPTARCCWFPEPPTTSIVPSTRIGRDRRKSW
jgi:hypothetical protein